METLPSFGIQGRGMECIKFLNLFLAGLGAEDQAEKGAVRAAEAFVLSDPWYAAVAREKRLAVKAKVGDGQKGPRAGFMFCCSAQKER